MALGAERGRLPRPRTLVLLLGAVVVGVAALRHLRGGRMGHAAPGGILVADATVYDVVTGFALGSFYERIAADVAAIAPDGARVLEVGCGPGHLSMLLAGRHGLDVTGLDLDPAMIARANARRPGSGDGARPSFLVGDVASLAFPDASFDLVVSTLSMHHWDDPSAGLAEIGRVLRPGARALVWDLRPGVVPFHQRVPDPVHHAEGSALRVVGSARWRWPFGFSLTQRTELVRSEGSVTAGAASRLADAAGARRLTEMVVCVPVTGDGSVDPRWGRADRVAIAEVTASGVGNWQEFDVGWGALHDEGAEGSHHARVARFLLDHQVEAIVADHMGQPMMRMLEQMGLEVHLGAGGDARQAAMVVIDTDSR